MYRKINGDSALPWSDEKIRDSINSAGVHKTAAKKSSGGGGSSSALNYGSSDIHLVQLREAIRDDALYGTVGGVRPGLEAVLDHINAEDGRSPGEKDGSGETD
jgi:hypothetical protein